MREDRFHEYEADCIRTAAGRPTAELRAASPPGLHRSRTYLLDGPQGGSFVKCLDAGHQNRSAILLSLDHEAEGYRFFAGLEGLGLSLPQVHFFQSFPGPAGSELQVLGVTNLEARGLVTPLREIYQRSTLALESKVAIVAACGRAVAACVSNEFQARLDRAAGVASVRRQTDRLLNHPRREELLAAVENHRVFPWAYQNKVIGEINALVPRWIASARGDAGPQVDPVLDQIVRVLTDRDLIEALAPGPSADRIVFSPCDRHVGNTLWCETGEGVGQLFEVDLESWGLETAGRLVGRYAAHWRTMTVHDALDSRSPEPPERLYRHLAGAFCYHFIHGDGAESPEGVLRAVSVGLAGFHAAIYCLYLAARRPGNARRLLSWAIDHLAMPDRFLALAADFGAQQAGETDLVMESVEQVREAMRPLAEMARSHLER